MMPEDGALSVHQGEDLRMLASQPGMGKTTARRLSDVQPGGTDVCGRRILEIFARREDFAIYLASRAGWLASSHGLQPPHESRSVRRSRFWRHAAAETDNVHIQYSDDPRHAEKQIHATNKILSRRVKMAYLAQDLRNQRYYTEQLAVAMCCALEDDLEMACDILQQNIENATEDRARIGRSNYLLAAFLMAGSAATVLLVIGHTARFPPDWIGFGLGTGAPITPELSMLLLSACGGAIGAFFSIAIAIRSRTVAPDRSRMTNWIDGGLRITIGMISGFCLHLLLTTGILDALSDVLKPSDAHADPVAHIAAVSQGTEWRRALSIGFIGGFLERLVPDLLDKRTHADTAAARAGTTPPG